MKAECKDEETLLREKILELVERRGTGKTCCPSEVVRSLFPADWRDRMEQCRAVGWILEGEGRIEVCQGGLPVSPPVTGPIRFRLKKPGNK